MKTTKSLAFDHFVKKIHIKAPLENLYRCWATSAGYESWFLRSCTFKRDGQPIEAEAFILAGDVYAWKWHNWDGEEMGKVLEANGKNKVVLSFAGNNKVTIELKDVGKAVLVTLTQSDIPTDEKTKLEVHYGCSNGWTFWLANLKAKLEYGITLNETEFDLRDDPMAGWEYVNI